MEVVVQVSPEAEAVAVGTFEALVSSVINNVVEQAVEAALLKTRESDDVLLDAKGAGEVLSLSPEAVSVLAKRGRIPSVVMPNNRRRFEGAALLDWAKSEQR